MKNQLARRDFIRGSLAAAAAVLAYNPTTRSWATQPGSGTIAIPNLDGTLVMSGPLLDQAADDFGHVVSHTPVAVLNPGSIRDIERLIRFANRHGLRVGGMSMIGNSHSTNGQSQVDAGVVIDMAALCEIDEIDDDDDAVWVDAGVRWFDLLQATLPLGKSPPTLTDLLDLSVGGTLSVGGIGGQAFRHGLMVDNVLELQVITGKGKRVTCSPTRKAGLFHAVRAGLGQFAIIVRARVRLIEVPPMVRMYTALYPTAAALMDDQRLVIADGRFDYVEGQAFPDGAGGWIFGLEATRSFAPGAPPDDAASLAGLSFLPGTLAIEDRSYDDFADRLAPLVAFLKSIGVWSLPHPWLNLFVPGAQAASFVQETLDNLTVDDLGQGPVLIYPFHRAAVTADFMPLPAGDVSFLFALLRNSVPPTPERIAAQVQQNRNIYDRLRALGGTLYAISNIPFSHGDWQNHFGTSWSDFVRAKERYDPNHVLTPGQAIF